jgi:tyrosine-protein phosphatase SIW14
LHLASVFVLDSAQETLNRLITALGGSKRSDGLSVRSNFKLAFGETSEDKARIYMGPRQIAARPSLRVSVLNGNHRILLGVSILACASPLKIAPRGPTLHVLRTCLANIGADRFCNFCVAGIVYYSVLGTLPMNFCKSFFHRRTAVLLVASALPLLKLEASDLTGVGNFAKVDEHVYRGAQPSDQGFQSLAKLGIVTVIDLREPGERAKDEEKVVKAAGMQYISVPMKGMATPSDASVIKVLTLLEDRSTGPVFVHCLRGADRTGGIIACYRVEHDHWQNDRAVAEARSMGMSWYQRAIQHYVLNFRPKASSTDAPKVLASESSPSIGGLLPVTASAIQ